MFEHLSDHRSAVYEDERGCDPWVTDAAKLAHDLRGLTNRGDRSRLNEENRLTDVNVIPIGLGWLRTEEGKKWLRYAPLERLVGRQAVLIGSATAAARE